MPLVPFDGILAVVSKMERESPTAARELVALGLYEALCDQVDLVRPGAEPLMLAEIREISKEARATIVRMGVSKAAATGELYGEGAAGVLEEIDDVVQKGLIGSLLSQFNHEHPRDGDGRFIRVSVKGQDPNLSPSTRSLSSHNEGRARLQEMRSQGLVDDDTPVKMIYRRQNTKGRLGGELRDGKSTTAGGYDVMAGGAGSDEVLSALQVRRKDLPHHDAKRQASLDMLGLMTNQDAVGSQRLLRSVERTDMGSSDQIAGNWNGPSQGGASMDRQAYRRTKMLGQALSGVSAPGSELNVAGGLAQLIGEIGPEAEKVLAPGIRRAAYRYRGTERRPDSHLIAQVKEANAFAEGRGDHSQKAGTNPAASIGVFYDDQRMTKDRRALSTVGDAAVAYMLGLGGTASQIPDRKTAELSMASGEVPPSRGVIIDADGDVVSQAVGFNGDHYLPFDLRNLNSLQGGQYVRTRATGGLTGEDLYTSLMTGARQAQVVSQSGVFTLEFDPDLRGGRRYSDKARRMVTRYEQMLQAINDPQSKLYERDLSSQERQEIRQRAAGASRTEEEFRTQVTAMESQARVMGSMGAEDDDDEAYEAADSRAKAKIKREYAQTPRSEMPSAQQMARILEETRNEELREVTGGGVKRLTLNGAGYDRAAQALKQEFPYFIRSATWKPLPDWISTRGLRNTGAYGRVGANDRGHVEPGQTNPSLGRVGVNARRTVPAANGRKAEAPVPETTAAAPTTAAATTSTAAATPALAKDVFTEKELIKPGTKVFYKLTDPAAKLVSMAAAVKPLQAYAGDPDELADVKDPVQYTYARALSIDDATGESGRGFVDWFFNKATPKEQSRILKGFKKLADTADAEGFGAIASHEAVEASYDALVTALDLVRPYAVVEPDDDPVVSYDNSERPKPVAPEKLNLSISTSSDPADIEREKQRLTNLDPGIGKHLTEMATETNEDRESTLQAMNDRFQTSNEQAAYKELERAHIAWSVLHTQEVAAELRAVMGDPKVTKRGPRPRKVVVHKLDDPFSRRTRARLGIPEPTARV